MTPGRLLAQHRHHIVRPRRTEGLLLEDVQLVAHLRRLFERSIASCATALWTPSIISLLFFCTRFSVMP
jgi:hypothetical protein